jgi:hypothetical protein
MQALHLHFHGPYPLCSETADVLDGCKHHSSVGLYLWVVRQNSGRFKITYLGQTRRSFYDRTKEHIIQTLGGNYRVIDADQMILGIEQIIWDGQWRRDARKRLPEFLNRYEELAPLIKRYLYGQVVFVAPFQGEGRLLRRIEGALASKIRSDSSSSSIFPSDIRYVIRNATESAVAVAVSADQEIEGMPVDLLV